MIISSEEISRKLSASPALWAHWGFEPWRDGALGGVFRPQHFVKDGFLGRIAEYGARDCIIWETGGESDRQRLWESIKPIPEVMTQRFLFILPEPWPKRRIKSFWLGFKGYLEFYAWWPEAETAAPPDLTGLVKLGLRPERQMLKTHQKNEKQ
ncbi:hypothetical protein C4J81_06730 [Deltaproteobacteria bacterium Smac51]|nr:hypothetical protein C4J81_06730 [Deltaproteobacteria bacterium Smac51]